MWVCFLVKPSISVWVLQLWGFPGGTVVKDLPAHAGDTRGPCLSSICLSIYHLSVNRHILIPPLGLENQSLIKWMHLLFTSSQFPTEADQSLSLNEWLKGPYWLRDPSLFYLAMDNSRDCGTQTTQCRMKAGSLRKEWQSRGWWGRLEKKPTGASCKQQKFHHLSQQISIFGMHENYQGYLLKKKKNPHALSFEHYCFRWTN